VTVRYQVSSDQGLCNFALQLASRPQELPVIVRFRRCLTPCSRRLKKRAG
jgi:hypothetical protein